MREIQIPVMAVSAAGTDTSHSSNITDAITPSFHSTNSNIEVTQTPSKAVSSVFTSQASLESFLLQHIKSKLLILHLKTVGYSIAERVSITFATAAKVIGLYGFYPPKDKLNMVSVFLSGITGLKPEDFFEPKSHKVFLAKCIENACRKLNCS